MAIFFRAAGSYAELTVAGNGPGWAGDPLTSAGIGLQLVRQVVETDLCGEVGFSNRIEGGVVVRSTFPLIPP